MLSANARRHLDILSHTLDPLVYECPETVDALSALARRHKLARVRILVQDTLPLIERGHALVRLAQRYRPRLSCAKNKGNWKTLTWRLGSTTSKRYYTSTMTGCTGSV